MPTYVDLSFAIEDGMPTLPGVLPEARIGAFIDHDASRERYEGKAEFYLGRFDMPPWPADRYFETGPWLSSATLDRLIEGGAAIVGVDFNNVDDTSDPARPAHTRLLAAGIPIVERLRGLDALPRNGFRFFAVPPRIVRGASFPVRAFAELP